MVYTLRFFFSSKCSLFHNSNVFGCGIIHILYIGVLKLKKNNSGAKRLIQLLQLCERRQIICDITINFGSIIVKRAARDKRCFSIP